MLLRPNLALSLEAWLATQPPAQTLAIIGGGEVIDAVRRLDKQFACDPSWTHWQCVGLLNTTYHWLSRQLPQWKPCSDQDAFRSLGRTQHRDVNEAHLLAVDSFYRPIDHSPLPETWATTTDAIAGWLSVLTSADEMVLLKSCPTDDDLPLQEHVERGVVDDAILCLENQLPRLRTVDFTQELIS